MSITIKSKMFQSADYDAETKILTLTFTCGAKYAYSNFDANAISAFEKADSKGTFYSHNIRGQYPCTKLAA